MDDRDGKEQLDVEGLTLRQLINALTVKQAVELPEGQIQFTLGG